MLCELCMSKKAAIRRPKNGRSVCKECFLRAFEDEVDETISKLKLFKPGETIAVGVSGGKDSSVVLHVLVTLNARHDYGVRLVMVAIDEGITGYRDHSLEAVHEQQKKYGLPLKILSYDQLFGWTMDRVVERIGKRGNCTYCGVFRRQSLERGAFLLSADKLATGHNADDAAETILMNLLRGDIARLQRCTHPFSGSEGELPRVKPLYHSYEKEIVLYARYRNLQYFATECLYAPNAYRGHARTFIKQLERLRPRSITDILISGQLLADSCRNLRHSANFNFPSRSICVRCGSISSKALCYACSLLDLLNGVNLRKDVELFKVSADLDKTRAETVAIEEIRSSEKATKKSCACKS